VISYPLDFSKSWSILAHDQKNQKVIISGHSKDIHTTDGQFGGNIIAVASYRDLKLSKENIRKVKHARRTGNIQLVKNVYERVIALHSKNNNL
jgi:hypothetical protein